MVSEVGLEPTRLSAPVSKTGVSTNSTTRTLTGATDRNRTGIFWMATKYTNRCTTATLDAGAGFEPAIFGLWARQGRPDSSTPQSVIGKS